MDNNNAENPLAALAMEDLTTFPEGFMKLQNALGEQGPTLTGTLLFMLVML